MPKKTSAYAPWLASRLRDPEVAAMYLKASLGSPEQFLKALRKVAEAHQVAKVAEAAGKQRESVYRMLSEEGNPRLDSLWAVLQAVGLQLTVDQASSSLTPDPAMESVSSPHDAPKMRHNK
jgi:probable addiction module antidote protein